jgi:hypothetical protein
MMSLRMRLDPFDWPTAIRGDGRRSWRHWPSRSIAVRALPTACVLAILLTACRDAPQTAPSPLPDPVPAPVAPPGQGAVYGVVHEHTSAGPRPLAGLRFKLMHPETCCPYSPDDPASEVTSDAAGRYTVFVPAARWVVLDLPAGSGFYAPCAPGFDSTQAKGEMNIDVVSEAVLMTTGLPDSLPSTVINVRGSVVERTASGTTRAVPGASVWFSGEVDSVPQPGTLSDVRGNSSCAPVLRGPVPT